MMCPSLSRSSFSLEDAATLGQTLDRRYRASSAVTFNLFGLNIGK